ncbi:MAG TPA: SRPBCC domain-containing protein [Puia sp.]|jgi:uncharacterized protein YndB with AHSA1/START domain|nr:SRPBCC domain-containing protein [Puia sp.]
MPRTIRHLISLQHPPELVWDYLTKPELLAKWLMPNNFQPTIGHQFRFTARPLPRFGFDGNIYCEVLEIIPLKKLAYSWQGGPGPRKFTLDSIVTWTIKETADGTDLLLEHSGFRGTKNFLTYFVMNKGWVKIQKRLLKLIAPTAYVHPTT